MARLIVIAATCGLTACSASAGSPPIERAETRPATLVDTSPPPHAGVDLSGAWATGSTGEPDVPRIVIRPPCNYSPPLWVLDQRGDTVRAWVIPESWAKGTASTTQLSTVGAIGRVSGVNLTMRATGARYVLRYDSTSGHLRGTLNGAPFWAVRNDVVRPEGCIPVP